MNEEDKIDLLMVLSIAAALMIFLTGIILGRVL